MKSQSTHKLVALVLVSAVACLGLLHSTSEARSIFGNGEAKNSTPVVVSATQLVGSHRIPATLEIGAAGVSFKNETMAQERRIRWREVVYWRYHGPRCECSSEENPEGCILRIFVLGPTHSREPLYFKVAGSEVCGQRIHAAMNQHHPFGGI